jgi:hypothetical protein
MAFHQAIEKSVQGRFLSEFNSCWATFYVSVETLR